MDTNFLVLIEQPSVILRVRFSSLQFVEEELRGLTTIYLKSYMVVLTLTNGALVPYKFTGKNH